MTVAAEVVGRIGPDHQEQIIDLKEIKDKIEYLVTLKLAADNASKDFSEAIKETAEHSGILASSLRKFVVARAGEKFAEKARECEQLSLLFEDVGG